MAGEVEVHELAGADAPEGQVEPAAQEHFYGEQSGTSREPFGRGWYIGHWFEDITPEEMQPLRREYRGRREYGCRGSRRSRRVVPGRVSP